MMHTTQLPATHDVVCFSHLRWSELPGRPHHLMKGFVRRRRVFYVEEPVDEAGQAPGLKSAVCPRTGIHVITPHAPSGWPVDNLLADFFASAQIHRPIVWMC